jgi:hypothetical protein
VFTEIAGQLAPKLDGYIARCAGRCHYTREEPNYGKAANACTIYSG